MRRVVVMRLLRRSSGSSSPFSVFAVVQPHAHSRARRKDASTVPDFSPFAGVRYARRGHPPSSRPSSLHRTTSSTTTSTRRSRPPTQHNSVRLILPRDEAPTATATTGRPPRFAQWLAEGVLAADPEPRFYAYRMEFTDPHGVRRHTRGVLGALALPEPGDDDVLPHERTLPKAKSDRLALLSAMRVNVDPIWGLSLGDRSHGAPAATRPLAALHRPRRRGARARRRSTTPSRSPRSRTLVGGAPIVLADGHHRFETALNYRKELAPRGRTGGADAIMTFVVELVDDELCIEPIHRLLDLARRHRRPRPARRRVRRPRRGPEHSRRRRHAGCKRCEPSTASALVDAHGLALAIPQADARAAALAGEHPGGRRDRRRGRRSTRRPAAHRRDVALPRRRPGRRRARRQGCGERGDPVFTGLGRRHAGRVGDQGAHAAEDDVLLAQAAHRNGVQNARLTSGVTGGGY